MKHAQHFRPLSGSYISQLSVKLIHQHMINVISVPYRGATFLNRAWELVKKSAMTDFRPLSGSYISQSNVLSEYVKNVNFRPLSGSYISQYKCMVYRLQVIIFPSPIGELHFSMKSWFTHLLRGIISVPYRGATFLNQTCGLLRYGLTYFRPLSGSYISQSAFYKFKRLSWRFPSPIGELHFSMGLHLWRIQEIWFPSPIGELHFSIGVQVPHIFRNKHFRPLSGSYISQFLHKSNKLTLIPISVPYRGATFLNFRKYGRGCKRVY